MNESDYYPTGTYNNPDAPWNEKINKPQKVEVTISITLSKTVEIEVDDYTTEEINEYATNLNKRAWGNCCEDDFDE